MSVIQLIKMLYFLTRCTSCGIKSNNQPVGDGCHTCQSGSMQIWE